MSHRRILYEANRQQTAKKSSRACLEMIIVSAASFFFAAFSKALSGKVFVLLVLAMVISGAFAGRLKLSLNDGAGWP